MGRRDYGGLKAAKTFKKGEHITDGDWLLVVKEIKETGSEGAFWCCELLVLEALQRPHNITGAAWPERRPGDEVSMLYDFGKRPTMGHIKAFIEALFAHEDTDAWPEDKWDTVGAGLLDASQPTRGIILRCNAITRRQTKDPSKFYTCLNWSPADDDEIERCADDVRELLSG